MSDPFEYKIEIFIPEEYLSQLREALLKAGAGIIGNYDSCLSVMHVRGYWRPMPGANPFQGAVGMLESAEEVKVEVNCFKEKVQATIEAIRKIHPYEEPVINIIPLANQQFTGSGENFDE